jgi:hypothetical protein
MCSFIRDYILMPEALKEKMSKWSFATKTGKHEKYQGADYVLEEYNKTLLRCLCPSPSFPDWFQTTRLLPLIEHVRNEFREKMKRTDTVKTSEKGHLQTTPWTSCCGNLIYIATTTSFLGQSV